jgi:hypothetical protein
MIFNIIKTNTMAKTKPIGVRFDTDVLEDLFNKGYTTPQQVINHLSEEYWAVKKGTSVTETKKIAQISLNKPLKSKNKVVASKTKEPQAIPPESDSQMPQGLTLGERIEWLEKNKH